MKVVNVNGTEVKVVYPEEVDNYLTSEDKEMDARCCAAVEEAIRKKEFLEAFNKKNNIN